MSNLPILYSFRRCPYAMRARLALHYAQVNCIIREVDLKNKPAALIEISPKATVPVLHFAKSGLIIEESLEIIEYALDQRDPEGLLCNADILQQKQLIARNDTEFVVSLRKYKYFQRYLEATQLTYRSQGEQFLQLCEEMLQTGPYLFGKKTMADLAIFPFIRQFAFVDPEWFFNSQYQQLIRWLNSFLQAASFEQIVMQKHNVWQPEQPEEYFL